MRYTRLISLKKIVRLEKGVNDRPENTIKYISKKGVKFNTIAVRDTSILLFMFRRELISNPLYL